MTSLWSGLDQPASALAPMPGNHDSSHNGSSAPVPPPVLAPRAPDDPNATTRMDPTEPGADSPRRKGAHHGSGSWPTFLPNASVAGRFKILRWIGDGGMGEVFEAEDTELEERVALKTLHPAVTAEPGALKRFRREVHLARQVTHPNVCRTFDIFHHPLESTPGAAPVAFVSMELLQGETLGRRIRRNMRLSPRQALPIVRQLAAALAAAHDAGVIHRDFKSGNVMLVPSSRGERAVVTDFGLARGESQDRAEAAVAGGLPGRGSGMAGTPAYMAPEQLNRGEITPAVDVYAFGVVIFEMVTGRLPFEGVASIAEMMRRSREEPPSPRGHVPDLDPRWEAVILRCLRHDPAARFRSALDVVAALEESVALVPTRQPRRRRFAPAVAASLALVLGLAWWQSNSPVPVDARLGAPAAATAARRSVAVLGFSNLSGQEDAAWLSAALSEMLAMELAAGKALRVIPGESVARMKLELALPEIDALAAATLVKVRSHLGSDLVVAGSYFATGAASTDPVRLDLRLQDALSGELVTVFSEEGTVAGLIQLIERAGIRVRSSLGIGEAAATGGLRVSVPSNPEAARLYVAGLEKLRQFDALSARRALERAVALEPSAPLPHSALAQAWAALGYDARSEAVAERAFELGGDLPREERLLVEGRYHEASKQWPRAIEIYTSLWNFFPDQAEYGLLLAAAQTSAGRGVEAIETLADLRQLPQPASEDPRIDLAEAVAAYSLADFSSSEAAAARAVEKSRQRGSGLLVARALIELGQAAWRVGDSARALVAVEEATGIFTELGERGGQAGALRLEGNILLVQGSLARARAIYAESLAIYRQIDHAAGISKVLNNIAIVRQRQGDLEAARETYEESLQIAREIGDPSLISGKLNNLGIVLDLQGDLEGARSRYEEALQIAREIGDRGGIASRMNNLAELHRRQGDLEGAERIYRQAAEIWRQIDDRRDLAYTLNDLGALLLVRGDLGASRRTCDQALAIRSQLGDAGDAAVTRLALAAVAIEEGKAREAEAFARQALETFRLENRSDDQASATALMARSLLVRGETSAALAALEQAQELLADSSDAELRLSVELHAARVAGVVGDADAALERFERVRSEAAETGFAELRLAARLARGEIEIASGIAGGRDRLAALEREAAATGFGRIAARARRLLDSVPVATD